MPNIGPGELIVILSSRSSSSARASCPTSGAALGKSIREFRKAATDVKDSTRLDPLPPQSPQAPHPAAARRRGDAAVESKTDSAAS